MNGSLRYLNRSWPYVLIASYANFSMFMLLRVGDIIVLITLTFRIVVDRIYFQPGSTVRLMDL